LREERKKERNKSQKSQKDYPTKEMGTFVFPKRKRPKERQKKFSKRCKTTTLTALPFSPVLFLCLLGVFVGCVFVGCVFFCFFLGFCFWGSGV